MIAYLKGFVKDVFDNFVILNTDSNVGYKIEGLPVEAKIIEKELGLYIYTHYTQQEVRLFGFLNRNSYLLFQDLLTVSGVGPKSAVNLLNNLSVDSIKLAIIEKTYKILVGNGVGQKIAQKIIIELDGKYERNDLDMKNTIDGNITKNLDEVSMALGGLGYNNKEVSEAIKSLDKDTLTESFEKIFRTTLNLLHKKVDGEK